MKQLLKWILPHGVVRMLQTRQERGYQRSRELIGHSPAVQPDFSYEDIVRFLRQRGLEETQIREGSIPSDSLRYITSFLPDLAAPHQSIRGLHIGNFLGVSLASVTSAAANIHPDAVVVAIDPNLEHRGISHPQDHVCALLTHGGIAANAILCCGFSDEKNVANDGRNYLENYRLMTSEEIAAALRQQHAPDSVILQLQRLNAGPFDFALIDGNHESTYVRQELQRLHPLMKPGGLIFMDDASEGWPMLKQVFETSDSDRYQCLESDGRIGVLKVLAHSS